MFFLRKIIARAAHSASFNPVAPNPVHSALQAGQRAQRHEDYRQALTHFTTALNLAERAGDYPAQMLASLQRAEMLIWLGEYTTAEQTLLQLRHHAQITSQHTQLCHTLTLLGQSALAQHNQEEAQHFYEQAQMVAQSAHSASGLARASAQLAERYLDQNNASYALHLLEAAAKDLPHSGDIETSVHFYGLLGHCLILTGDTAQGEALLQRALRIAEQLEHYRFERRWAWRLGQHYADQMYYITAQPFYAQALSRCHAETPSPAEQAQLLTESAHIHLYTRDTAQALHQAQQALTLCEQQGLVDQHAAAQAILGLSLHATGNPSDAQHHLQVTAQAHLPLPLHLEIQRGLAGVYAALGDHTAALAQYEDTLQQAHDQPGALAQTHVEAGRYHEKQYQFTEALRHWRAAIALYNDLGQTDAVTRLHCDCGRIHYRLGPLSLARREYDQALMLLSSVKDRATRGLVLANAAITYAETGDTETTEAFFQESIEIAQHLGDTTAQAIRLGNYGWFLWLHGRARQALNVLQPALKLSQQLDLTVQAALQQNTMGLVHAAQNNDALALEQQQAALQQIETVNLPHWHALIWFDVIDTLLRLNRVAEAEQQLTKALHLPPAGPDPEIILRGQLTQARLALHPLVQAPPTHLENMITQARQQQRLRILAEALTLQSQSLAQQRPEQAHTHWQEARQIFTTLHMRQAEQTPNWLPQIQSPSLPETRPLDSSATQLYTVASQS